MSRLVFLSVPGDPSHPNKVLDERCVSGFYFIVIG